MLREHPAEAEATGQSAGTETDYPVLISRSAKRKVGQGVNEMLVTRLPAWTITLNLRITLAVCLNKRYA